MHTGPVVIDFTDTHVVVKCPFGHLVTSHEIGATWGGSWIEAKIAAYQAGLPWSVECDGHVAPVGT